jgi:single-stranded-DNA-specific exonuclease
LTGRAGTRAAAAPVELSAGWQPAAARWHLRAKAVDPAAAAALSAQLGLPATLCSILIGRGIGDVPDATAFLRPRMDRLRDPTRLAGMEQAVERVQRAIAAGETILVHGDYDVDGMCSAALLTRVLRGFGARVMPFVPHRMTDGYDLGHAGVRAAAAAGAGLILTADCGIVAHDAVAQAAAAGIDVVVTDHHTPGSTLPDAVAVVNPNRPDCGYGETGLAGVGVAFKLCQALARARSEDEQALWYHLDLVALATVADLAPLKGENRILTHFGLRVLRQSRSAGVRALLRVAGLADAESITAGQVGHVLAPRLNALGRLGAAERGLALLLEDDDAAADRLAHDSDEENRRRQSLDRFTLDEALRELERSGDPAAHHGVVIAGSGWHPGVIGIVASRVVERIHRPTVLLAVDAATGMARGSARSVTGVDLYAAVKRCGHLLERFGGHAQAAGMDIRIERIDAFRDAFAEAVAAVMKPDALVPVVSYDVEAPLASLDGELLGRLRHLGPFGIGNPTPVFAIRGACVRGAPRTVGGGHLKVMLEQDGVRLPGIGFSLAARCSKFAADGAAVDVALQLQEDSYRGGGALQGRIIDLRPAGSRETGTAQG